MKLKSVLIVENEQIKEELLYKRRDVLNEEKIFTIDEFIKNLLFDYTEETIYYIVKNYDVIPSVAKIYLENLYYIDRDYYENDKLKFLCELKNKLDECGLLTYNTLFLDYIKDVKVLFYMSESKYISKIAKMFNLNYEYLIDEDKNYIHKVNEFDKIDDEIVFVASKIVGLIKNGIKLDNIYITNLNQEYRVSVKRIFSLFNIPVKLKSSEFIYSTNIVQSFLDNYEQGIDVSLDIISKKIKNDEEKEIYNKLIDIINKYNFIKEEDILKKMIIYELKKTKVSEELYSNQIKEVELKNTIFNDDEYVFLMNFNQGSIPIINKDEDYLNDKTKELLGIDTSNMINKTRKNEIIKKIKNIKNLTISYMRHSLSGEYYPSSLVRELDLLVERPEVDELNYSNKYNKVKLVSYIEEYLKYNKINKNLPLLIGSYQIEKYSNKFSGIDKDKLDDYLGVLNLSYTSLNNYYKCAFKYYLSNILNLDIYEESFMVSIGNIFHKVLESVFVSQIDFDTLYQEAIQMEEKEFSLKEKFFLKKLRSELLFIIDTIKRQDEYSNLNKSVYETKVVTNIEGNIKISFSGKIDKIKYEEIGDKAIIAIIDYKTGVPSLNLDNVKYGLDMQLPIYIYLAKNSGLFPKIEVAGFYLQRIVNGLVIYDSKRDYQSLKREQLKLIGYSNSDLDVISEFDKSYQDSSVIKSLKMSKNGFYAYSKVLSSEEIQNIVNITEDKIKEGANKIINAEFQINPKSIKDENVGCKFCKFQDICFMKEEDIVHLGGESDGVD